MPNEKLGGGNIEDEEEEGMGEVPALARNKAIVVLPVNPATAGAGGKVDVFPAPTLGAVVGHAQPRQSYPITYVGPDGTSAGVVIEMRYGEGDAESVLDDFGAERLILKARRTDLPADAPELEKRPWLTMRLTSAAITDLLRDLTDPSSELGAAVKDPARRKQVREAVRERIALLEAEARGVVDREKLSAADAPDAPDE